MFLPGSYTRISLWSMYWRLVFFCLLSLNVNSVCKNQFIYRLTSLPPFLWHFWALNNRYRAGQQGICWTEQLESCVMLFNFRLVFIFEITFFILKSKVQNTLFPLWRIKISKWGKIIDFYALMAWWGTWNLNLAILQLNL